MKNTNKKLIISVDMYGCPNRCKHCWIGHMPNLKMQENDDRFIVDFFKPYFDSITFYSWLREPDFCCNYAERWARDNQISINSKPKRFELASFYRLVRDKNYVDFLKSNGTENVQLTFFGLEAITDKYVGRKGAFRELLKATEILIENKIAPRWQVFINTENSKDIVKLLKLSKTLGLSERCMEFGKPFVFFIHSGSCDGENRKLYNLRINKEDIPNELTEYYADFSDMVTEAELCENLKYDNSNFVYHNKDDIYLYVSNKFDVYFNFTHMTPEWKIGNLKSDDSDWLIGKIIDEDTPALNAAGQITVSELVKRYGNPLSHKIFDEYDYKAYLLNKHIEKIYCLKRV